MTARTYCPLDRSLAGHRIFISEMKAQVGLQWQ